MTVYTLFGQPASPAALVSDSNAYTMGVQFSDSNTGDTLTGIWFFSAAGAASLPDTIALYAVSGTSLVHSESASWSGAAGSGWVRAPFATPPALTSGASYKGAAGIASPAGNWYSATSHYWDTGAGAGGVTSGPLTAPNDAGSSPGQDSFHALGIDPAYPDASFNATNYWVDVEVTTAGPPPPPLVQQAAAPESAGISAWVMLPARGRIGSAV